MNDPSGSIWRKWDLHLHTPKSYDYKNKGATAPEIIERLVNAGIEVVAVTDHHVLDAAFIRSMQKAGANRVTVLPGIELTSNLGGSEGVHFIALFDEKSNLEHLSNELMAKLDLASKRVEKVPEEKLYVDFPSAASVIQKLGGIISIHAHGKASNFESITSALSFKQQQKTDLLRDSVDILEVGSVEKADEYRSKIFPNIGFELPMVVCSDNHNCHAYACRETCWIKADPTFAGLQMALRVPSQRFHIGVKPDPIERLERNKTRYIKSFCFNTEKTMPKGETWFDSQTIPLNPGLVAVIGNKGSGKSALADCVGLLGSCCTSDAFSFLTTERFKNPKTGRAQHVSATMTWHDGPPTTRRLNDEVKGDEVERVKYLPQSFVEKVCNDMASPGGGNFEGELKKVIFSKVGKADRLGKQSLDELVAFRTQELRNAAAAIALQIKGIAQERAMLEVRLDPQIKAALENRIQQKAEEIKSHEANKPAPRSKPADDPLLAPDVKVKLEQLAREKENLAGLEVKIGDADRIVAEQQLRAATAQKLLDKLKNLEDTVAQQITYMGAEAQSLGINIADVVTLGIKSEGLREIRDQATAQRDAAKTSLDNATPPGLKLRKAEVEALIKELQGSLAKPQQEYEAYLSDLARWQQSLNQLNGSRDEPASLKGLQGELESLADVPTKIHVVDERLYEAASKIHEIRVQEAAVFTSLYETVQKFVETHKLAKNQLRLEFKVELVQEGFIDSFISHLNQQRQGSFCGAEEGRVRAINMIAPIDWPKWQSVSGLLKDIEAHLRTDKRNVNGTPVLVTNQIGKGKTLADMISWLFSLDYIRPRYLLRWEGKDVNQLSPGERGTLLLIFYLLVDEADVPLVIDQPEANLDNLTVAQKLADCISDARQRRQVIIVTHNPNLAVVCDADQLIHASMDKQAGNKITYKCGALEHPELNRFAIDVLEGSRKPFDLRDMTYEVMGE